MPDDPKLYEAWPPEPQVAGPAWDFIVANLSDTLPLTKGTARGIYLDSAGTVKFVTPEGTTNTILAFAIGIVHPIAIKQIWATGTTVTPANVYVVY